MTKNKNNSVSILIAEDSKTQVEILRHLLESDGYSVKVAYNGREALDQIKKEQPDLVLTDVMMPEMNGYELCKNLKSDPDTSSIPVILVTSLDSKEDREHGITVGADAYIVKSGFDHNNLLEVINRLI